MKKEYPWEVRSDAETMQRYQEIIADPNRVAQAKEFLQDQINTAEDVVKNSGKRQGRKHNPATITRLPDFRKR